MNSVCCERRRCKKGRWAGISGMHFHVCARSLNIVKFVCVCCTPPVTFCLILDEIPTHPLPSTLQLALNEWVLKYPSWHGFKKGLHFGEYFHLNRKPQYRGILHEPREWSFMISIQSPWEARGWVELKEISMMESSKSHHRSV